MMITPPQPPDTPNPELEQTLSQLTLDQTRFVLAYLEIGDKGKAAAAIGIKPDTVYHWPPVVDKAIRLLVLDAAASGRQILRQGLLKAVGVMLKLLDSDDESVRYRAAKDIIEYTLGKARQQTDVVARVDLVDYRTAIFNKLAKATVEDDPTEDS